MLDFNGINWIAVIVATVVSFGLGGLWYSPILFAKEWTKLINKSEADLKEGAVPGYVASVVLALIEATFLAALIKSLNVTSVEQGCLLGIMIWVGFVGPTSLIGTIFKGERKKLWAIDFGYHLVTLAVMGAIIAWWPY